MAKTKKAVAQKFEIYQAGRKAAQAGQPRFAPYTMSNSVQTWFAGYDSAKLHLDTEQKQVYTSGIGVTE